MARAEFDGSMSVYRSDSTIRYESRGRGRPFIFLHGSPSDHARAMASIEPAFRPRDRWRRVYPDLPGHGGSPGSSRIRDMDGFLQAMLEFVDDIARGGPFCIGGISMGAYLALGIARKRASRVDGLLLSVPEMNHSPLEDRRDAAHGTPSRQTPPSLAADLPKYHEDTAWLEGLPFHDVSFDLYHSRRPFQAPALFLLGRQDAAFRYRKYWQVLSQFPRATFAVLDGAGHGLWHDRNRLACELVRDWCERVETYAAPSLRR